MKTKIAAVVVAIGAVVGVGAGVACAPPQQGCVEYDD